LTVVALCVLAIVLVLHMGMWLKEAMAKRERRQRTESDRCQVCRQVLH
jgi:heme exporter protein D